MSKRNKNLKKGITDSVPSPNPEDVPQNTAAPDANLETVTPVVNPEIETPAPPETPVVSEPSPAAEITEKEFVPTADNAPEGMGWCAICKRHNDLKLMSPTSERNVYTCKAFCKVKNNIVNLAAGADAAARVSKKRAKSSEPRPQSKVSKILEYVKDRNMFTVKEISECCGHDLKNASVSLTILKNPVRTKNPIPFQYHSAKKLWIRIGYDPSSGTTETAPSTAPVDAGATPQADAAGTEDTAQA